MLYKRDLFDCIEVAIVSPGDYCKGWNDAVDNMPKWISVEERLPEKSGLYLAFTIAGNTMTLDYSAKYRAFNAFDHRRRNEVFEIQVTHWMLLPEAPKGG